MESVDKDVWTARAVVCELLALSFRYPGEDLARALASGEWVEAAVELSDVLDLGLSEDFGENLVACAEDADSESSIESILHDLRVEATRLFVGAPEPACSPYEGTRRAEAEGAPVLMFVNPHSMEVERFCRACGLGRPEGTNEPLDHVATEFELLQILALRAAGADAVEGDGVAQAELPGGSAAAAYDAFVREHVRSWMLEFAEDVAVEARQPFYRAAAQLLRAFVVSA